MVVVGKGGRIEGGGWEPKFRVFGRSFAAVARDDSPSIVC